MPKNQELADYEEVFPEPISTPRTHQRIKRTGTLARLPQSIRIAQQTNTQYIIDVSDRFQFEIQKLLAILQVATVDQEERIIVIPYQPSELQLSRIYQILPIDKAIIAKEWSTDSKNKHLPDILRLLNQLHNPRSSTRYPIFQGASAYPETRVPRRSVRLSRKLED